MSCGSSQNTTTSSSAPPAWLEGDYQNLIGQAQNTAATPYTPYNGNLVAPLTSDQTQAGQEVEGAQGVAQPYISAAQGDIANSTKPLWDSTQQFSPGAVQQYESPYTSDVVNATEKQFNDQNAEQLNQVKGNAIAQGAFGGDREAVAEAQTAQAQDIAEAPQIASLENTGYNTALGEFNTQQQAQLGANEANSWLNSQAGAGEANLGNEALGSTITGANALAGVGLTQQQENQENLNVPYEQYLAQQAYPYQQQSWLSGIETGAGSNAGGTSSTTAPGPSTASQVIGGIGSVASLAGLFLKTGGIVHHPMGTITYVPRKAGGIVPRHLASGGSSTPYSGSGFSTDAMGVPVVGGLNLPSVTITRGSGLPGAPTAAKTSGGVGDLGSSINSAASSSKALYDAINGGSSLGDPESLLSNDQVYNMGLPTADAVDANAFDVGPITIGEKTGGIVGHYDAGGIIGQAGAIGAGMPVGGGNPIAARQMAQFQNVPPEKLQELAARIPAGSPQGQVIQRALQTRRMQPMAQPQSGIMAPQAPQGGIAGGLPQPPMNRGGIVHHYDDGGGVIDDPALDIREPGDPDGGTMPEQIASAAPAVAEASALAPSNAPSTDNGSPAGGIAPPTKGGVKPLPSTAQRDLTAEGADQKRQDILMSILKGSLATMGGTSPNALTNIGQGGLAGLNAYSQQRQLETTNAENQQKELDAQARDAVNATHIANMDSKPMVDHSGKTIQVWYPSEKMMVDLGIPTVAGQQADETTARDANTAKYQATMAGVAQENAANGKFTVQPGMGADTNGNQVAGAYVTNAKTGEMTFKPGVVLTPKGGIAGPTLSDEAIHDLAVRANTGDHLALTGLGYGSSGAANRAAVANKMSEINQQNNVTPEQIAENQASFGGTQKAFTSGDASKTIKAANTYVEHLDVLKGLSDALQNGDVQVLNAAKNRFQREFGVAAPNNWDAAMPIVQDEGVKAILGSAGALGDRDQFQKPFSSVNSPEQLSQAIDTQQALMKGQMDGMRQRYIAGTRQNDFDTRFLTPEARDVLQRHGYQIQTGNSAAPAQSGQAQPAPAPMGPPPAAIGYLKAHTEMLPQFNAKYGPNAGASYLSP